MIISYNVISFFKAKQNQVFKLHFSFNVYFYINAYKEPEPAIFFFNTAPAPLKKGGTYRLQLPSPVSYRPVTRNLKNAPKEMKKGMAY